MFRKILAKSSVKKSMAGIVFELAFRSYSFRLYASGKIIVRSLESKEELNRLLSELLS